MGLDGTADLGAGRLIGLLIERGLTIATAESCTGGMIGAMLTGVAGASAGYVGGWVTYTDRMKVDCLGVDAGVIAARGAVSGEVAVAMAAGAVARSGADVGVAVTGIAGPDGGSEQKPVGTVWLGFGQGFSVVGARCFFEGDRAAVRRSATRVAIEGVRLLVLGEKLDGMEGVREVVTGTGG